ncbi:hypothetical protein F5050DRAFT_1365722 [Lentinula boryana]|uniref:Uncharacterized protein n=1 Tax=Lentinula boryana TaxID=40481 RepID=A0ABQ8PX63_9AGAR|nr:hypothetical protein F5050DRAFT_1365722 [Lentinula boryana]
MGGKFHLKLNIGERPIANKYREGKMKRTLERELNRISLPYGVGVLLDEWVNISFDQWIRA